MKLLLERLLTYNHYRMNKHDVSLQLLTHPDYPSLKSITDTLDYFKIENAALQVDLSSLAHLPNIFIGQLEKKNYSETVLITKHSSSIKITDDYGKNKKITLKEFKQTWNGKALLVEPQPSQTFKINTISWAVVFLLASLSFSLQWISYQSSSIISLITLLIGFGITFLILLDQYENSTILNKVCGVISESNNCLEVTKSEYGKIFKTFGLSDLSGVLFASLIINQIIVGWNPLLGVGLSFMIIPIILYSFYLQIFLIRKWCLLCVGISIALILYLIVSFLSYSYRLELFQLAYFIKFTLIIFFLGFIWYLLQPLFLKYRELMILEREYLQFKRNEGTFYALLNYETEVTPISEISSQITFGNCDAQIEILSITNPLCGYCKEAFFEYKKLLNQEGKLLKLNFIFNVANRPESDAFIISNQLISIYQQEGQAKCWAALEDWFNSKNVDSWLEKYKHSSLDNTHTINTHYQWCRENKILFTPATVLDGHLYPKGYKVSEFILLAEDYLERKKHRTKDILKD